MDDVDLFIRTPQSRQVERDAIDRQTKQYLAQGGEITFIPFGMGSGFLPIRHLRFDRLSRLKRKIVNS